MNKKCLSFVLCFGLVGQAAVFAMDNATTPSNSTPTSASTPNNVSTPSTPPVTVTPAVSWVDATVSTVAQPAQYLASHVTGSVNVAAVTTIAAVSFVAYSLYNMVYGSTEESADYQN